MDEKVNNFPSQLWEEYLNTLEVLKASMQNARTKHTNIKKQEAEQNSKEYTNSQIKVVNDNISLYVKKNDLDSLIQQMPDSIKVAFNNISTEWIFDANKFINKVNGKTGLTLSHGRLNVNRFDDGKPVGYYGQTFSNIQNSDQRYWGNVISGTYRSYYTDIGYNPNVMEDGDSTETGFTPFMKFVFYPYGTAYPSQGIYVFKDMIFQEKLEIMNALKLHRELYIYLYLNYYNYCYIFYIKNCLYRQILLYYCLSDQHANVTLERSLVLIFLEVSYL